VAAATPLENDLTKRFASLAGLILLPALTFAELHVVIIEGLPGDQVYAEQFDNQVTAISTALRSVTDAERVRVFRADDVSRDAVLGHLRSLQSELRSSDQFALFLIGHGSYDDVEYKFNIPGPDLTGEDIAAGLDELPTTNQVLVNTSSASGAIIDLVSNDDRIVVLATRSGAERHATRFGDYFATALGDPGADIDKNQRISVEEAFGFAERQVSDYFERNDQLATEHARLEGEHAGRLALARLDGAQPNVVDTALGKLVADRDALNANIEALRLARDDMPLADYQSALLERMLELARVEDAIEARQDELDAND
jgi:hypothetical protein